MRKRPIFCGWCGTNVGEGHAADCPHVTEGRITWEHEPDIRHQSCGHPVQAIHSRRDKGNRTSNWCGWCAEVARLREALKGMIALTIESNCAYDIVGHRDWPEVARARTALSTLADDWLERHDAEVRERCAVKCDEIAADYEAQMTSVDGEYSAFADGGYFGAQVCATAIRNQEAE